jgi:hypothetical protein
MKLEETFIHYGSIDTTPFLKGLGKLTKLDWDRYEFRQKDHPYHAATKTIPIIYDENYGMERGKESIFYDLFTESVEAIEKFFSSVYNKPAVIIRYVIVNLPANAQVQPHYDRSKESFNAHSRVHIPIITHPKVEFTVGNDTIFMPPGEVYEINNDGQKHGVKNSSHIDRVHAIVDWHVGTNNSLL